MRRQYFEVCKNCGAHLDPGERCDCEEAQQETTCIYCGGPIDEWNACECKEREKAFSADLTEARIHSIDLNSRLTAEEMFKAKDASNGTIDFAYNMYKIGLIRGRRCMHMQTAGGGMAPYTAVDGGNRHGA